ncbi:hypothetical protein Q3G72_000971 [Acer saccharum]|nr:hypothetical protein Q3G72_000971 [Acer saccharum]
MLIKLLGLCLLGVWEFLEAANVVMITVRFWFGFDYEPSVPIPEELEPKLPGGCFGFDYGLVYVSIDSGVVLRGGSSDNDGGVVVMVIDFEFGVVWW